MVVLIRWTHPSPLTGRIYLRPFRTTTRQASMWCGGSGRRRLKHTVQPTNRTAGSRLNRVIVENAEGRQAENRNWQLHQSTFGIRREGEFKFVCFVLCWVIRKRGNLSAVILTVIRFRYVVRKSTRKVTLYSAASCFRPPAAAYCRVSFSFFLAAFGRGDHNITFLSTVLPDCE